MNKRIKGIIAGVLVGALLASGGILAKIATQKIDVNYVNVKVYKDGTLCTLKDANGNVIEPFIYQGTTYLPVRAVANLAGMEVSWDNSTKSVYLYDNTAAKNDALVSVFEEYDQDNCLFYGADRYFTMDGVKYNNGIQSLGVMLCHSAFVKYNIENKYKSMDLTIGHTGSENREKTVSFIVDGKNIGYVTLKPGCKPERYTVNLYNGADLKITMGPDVGLGNIILK